MEQPSGHADAPSGSAVVHGPGHTIIGTDGNQYHCAICNGYGVIICCDSCPRVYHQACLPRGSPSLSMLEQAADDDPWYCPECVNNQKKKTKVTKSTPDRRIRQKQRLCFDCRASIKNKPLKPCDDCEKLIHFPYCVAVDSYIQRGRILCGTCRAVEMADDDKSPDAMPGETPSDLRKRSSSLLLSVDATIPNDEEIQPHGVGPVTATPAFHLFINSNRGRVERSVEKKSRNRKDLSPTVKNALLAREVAAIWTSLSSNEQRKYVNMSLADFEARVKEWKSQRALSLGAPKDDSNHADPEADLNTTGSSDALAEKRREFQRANNRRLFMAPVVGLKPLAAVDEGRQFNKVASNLLHNAYSGEPLLRAGTDDATAEAGGQPSTTLSSINQWYQVHGPTATSIGDECVGCSHGWNHYCSILKRRVPAAAARAQLGSGTSSLLATRVGLGVNYPSSKVTGSHPSPLLLFPHSRSSMVTEFVEKAVSQKIHVPQAPAAADQGDDSGDGSETAATCDQRGTWGRCAGCRMVSTDKMGCFECRRVELIVQYAKGSTNNGELSSVETSTLRNLANSARCSLQNESDKELSAWLVSTEWTPFAVMPPQGSGPAVAGAVSNHAQESEHKKSIGEATKAEEPLRVGEGERISASPSRRKTSMASFMDASEPEKRQKMMEKNVREVKLFQKYALRVACSGMILAIQRRDPSQLLSVSSGKTSGASDLEDIRRKIQKDEYKSLGGFVSDIKSICDLAMISHPERSMKHRVAATIASLVEELHMRALHWLKEIQVVHSRFLAQGDVTAAVPGTLVRNDKESGLAVDASAFEIAFRELRNNSPSAFEMILNKDRIDELSFADFLRTKANEAAYFGTIAVRRAAAAAAVSLSSFPDNGGMMSTVALRTSSDDSALRASIDEAVASVRQPGTFKQLSTWQEESIVGLLECLRDRRQGNDTKPWDEFENADVDANGAALEPGRSSEPRQPVPSNGDNFKFLPSVATKDTVRVGEEENGTDNLSSGETPLEARRATLQKNKFTVSTSPIAGKGVFANIEFAPGDVLMEYQGKLLHDNTTTPHAPHKLHYRIDEQTVLDASDTESPCRVVNHSCDPNCRVEVSDRQGEIVLTVVALRKIGHGAEITIKYRSELESPDDRIPCRCNSYRCTGFVNWIPSKKELDVLRDERKRKSGPSRSALGIRNRACKIRQKIES